MPSNLTSPYIPSSLPSTKKENKKERRLSEGQIDLKDQVIKGQYEKQIEFLRENLLKFKQEKQAEVSSELFVNFNFNSNSN